MKTFVLEVQSRIAESLNMSPSLILISDSALPRLSSSKSPAMSMDVLFRCNMDAVLRQIFLCLDPESLHRARQVCQSQDFSFKIMQGWRILHFAFIFVLAFQCNSNVIPMYIIEGVPAVGAVHHGPGLGTDGDQTGP